jgi:DNA-binding Lrp family transcriptional regulator
MVSRMILCYVHMIMPIFDKYDRSLLDILQRDAGLSRSELAAKVGLSDSQVARRRAVLESQGIIRRYRAELDAAAVGLAVTAFVHVKLHGHSKGNAKRFAELVRATAGIAEAHAVTGDFDYLLKARVRDLSGLQRLIGEVLLAHSAVDRVRSEIVLETLSENQPLDIRY